MANDDPIWQLFDLVGTDSWWDDLPAISYRLADANRIDFRVAPSERSGNRLGGLHGGFLAGLAEATLGLFRIATHDGATCVTVSLSFDYPSAGRVGPPIEGQLHLVRETGRMQFLRIVLQQDGLTLLHGNGVLRKLDPS